MCFKTGMVEVLHLMFISFMPIIIFKYFDFWWQVKCVVRPKITSWPVYDVGMKSEIILTCLDLLQDHSYHISAQYKHFVSNRKWPHNDPSMTLNDVLSSLTYLDWLKDHSYQISAQLEHFISNRKWRHNNPLMTLNDPKIFLVCLDRPKDHSYQISAQLEHFLSNRKWPHNDPFMTLNDLQSILTWSGCLKDHPCQISAPKEHVENLTSDT